MAAEFALEIVTAERVALKESFTSLTVPATTGSLGILARHAPLVSELDIGVARIRRPDQSEGKIALNGGFLMVLNNEATILTRSAELDTEIDLARAQAAVERPRTRIEDREASMDYHRAHRALLRAVARLKARQS